jgi:alpha-amylase/alpha-mannosidase (GH57 family)
MRSLFMSRLILPALVGLLLASLPGSAQVQAGNDVLYLSLVWHQHQPLYYKDDAGVYTRPWVRVHATQDYYDMAATLEKYPSLHVTFDLTPVLIRQLDDIASGAKDAYQVAAEIPAESLSGADKRFILQRFFDANRDHVIARFPRYKELLDKRRGSTDDAIEAAIRGFTARDFRDLQVWFNLAWFDPDFLSQEPLAALVRKGRDFTEQDKTIIFDRAWQIVSQVIPEHRKLQDAGQIEVITSPYAHPILPLIYNSDLAAASDPTAEMPARFSYPQDAIAQLKKSVDVYTGHFGRPPVGLWPSEGAVAQDIVKLVADAGYRWMASGEQVLAKSLGKTGFTRDSKDLVNEADDLYRPYYVRFRDGPRVAVVFRDLRLSDLIGFEYSGTPGETAAQDFMDRLEAIRGRLRAQGAQGPHLVSVILDGENAWENYDNDGKAFLNALYRKLSESDTIRTVTPSEYMAMFPDQRSIQTLWGGCWFSPDFATWIGEPEETAAWNYLGRTRAALAQYDFYKKKTTTPEKLAQALDYMYLAEGSDWFWWYGSDQDSGDDAYFDRSFRVLLTGVYTSLGVPAPDFLRAPIIAQAPVPATKTFDGAISPVVDGTAGAGEWDKAARFEARGGVMAGSPDFLQTFYFGVDDSRAYFRFDAREPWTPAPGRAMRVYLAWDPQSPSSPFTLNGSVLGYAADAYVEAAADSGAWKLLVYRRGKYDTWSLVKDLGATPAVSRIMEWGIPLSLLGDAPAGTAVRLRASYSEGTRDISLVPAAGPLEVVLPLVGRATPFLAVQDPSGDDNGPGSYAYPLDPVFKPGVFDITAFTAAETDRDLVFSFTMRAPIENPWGSATRLSLPTFDIYIDTDPGKGTGARMLLDGRNAALGKADGWEYALWVEGWNQKLYLVDAAGKPAMAAGSPLKVTVDGPHGLVIITVPKSLLPARTPPAAWGFAAMVLSQEGYPSPGVLRVRDVKPQAEQWRIGGAIPGTNATRIMDLAWDGTPIQAEILSKFTALNAAPMPGSPDDYAQIPLLIVH